MFTKNDDGAGAVYVPATPNAATVAAAHFMPDEDMIAFLLQAKNEPPSQAVGNKQFSTGWDTYPVPAGLCLTHYDSGAGIYADWATTPPAHQQSWHAALARYTTILTAPAVGYVVTPDHEADGTPCLLVRHPPPPDAPVQLSNELLLKMDPAADPFVDWDTYQPPFTGDPDPAYVPGVLTAAYVLLPVDRPPTGPSPSPAPALAQVGVGSGRGHSVIIAQTADVTTLA